MRLFTPTIRRNSLTQTQVQATEQCGRHNYAGILSHMKSKGCKNKTEDGVKQYSERFWTVGHLYLKKWKKYEARLMRAEEKNKEMESIRTNMNRIVSGYEYPYHQMCLDPRLHPRKGGHLEYATKIVSLLCGSQRIVLDVPRIYVEP